MRPAAVLVAILWGAACSFPGGEWFGRVPTPDPEHLTLCNAAEPESLDPPMATSTNAIRMAYELFDGLMTFDERGLATPSLAERAEASPDLRTFTFHLRRDARWSNGRPLDARDVVYAAARTLHPLTASPNAEDLWRLEHGREYTSGTARVVLRDHAPFVAGDVVVVDEPASQQNGRRTRDTTPLRAGPDEAAEVWDSLAAGAEVTIVELDGCARERSRLSECGWAYVFHPRGDGIFGYVPLSALVQASPDAAIAVTGGERKGTVPARDLLMVPEALGIDMPDRYTVIFRTGGPVPYFLDVSAQQVLRPVPREAVSRQPRRWTRPEHIVTSGPFHGVLWRARDRVEMVRSETFWGRATVKLARVTYLAVDDQATAVNLYFQGQCDVLVQNHIPSSYYPVLTGDSGGQKKRDYLRVPVLQTYFYLINVERHPNVHLRRALSHALDRRELALVTKGSVVGTPAYTPGLLVSELSDEERKLCGVEKDHPGTAMIVVAGELCYVPPLGPAFDLELAKKEWALAEQELGDKMPRTLTVRYNVGVEQHKLIAEWVQEQWRKHLGFRVEVETQDWQIFLDATRRRAYDVARFGAAGPYIDPENFMRTWLCAHPDNRAGWCNQEFQRLFLAADKEVDRRKRLELVRQAEKVMVDEVPIIPMALYSQHHLVKPYVRGYHVNLVDHQSLRGVWIDPDWAAK